MWTRGIFMMAKAKERPSFTCLSYQILQEPKPLTSSELKTLTQWLIINYPRKEKRMNQSKGFSL